MLTIRRSQMSVLADRERQRFEDRMVARLARCEPEQCAALGEPAVRQAVQHGLSRASEHGINGGHEAASYIELMFRFGRDFDRHCPWAWHILELEHANEVQKIEALSAEALRRRHEASGLASGRQP